MESRPKCARFTLAARPDLFATNIPFDIDPRSNAAPTQNVLAARLAPEGKREFVKLRWGLIPSWASDMKIGYKLINARSGTIAEKPSFRSAFKHKCRCLIVTDGFFEWKAEGKKKQPYLFRQPSGKRLGNAALTTVTRYFVCMPRTDRKPKARSSGDKWFVYMMRCADGSLYTGITKNVKRRCQQYNAGKASRYTRSRCPVRLVYHEDHPSQSSALKRESALKAMTRRGKLTMIQKRKNPAKGGREIAHLEEIPNIGPSIAADLRRLGITTPAELPGRDPYAMYDELCRITGQRHDPCLLDTFIVAVRYMEGAPKKPWWKYTAERKRELAARNSAK